MINLGIISMIGDILVVLLVLIGVVGVLVAIHCGSEFVNGRRNSLFDDTDRLRDDAENDLEGISRHNLLYKFIFRK